MPSLRYLLAEHAPLLVLDTASARVQAGLLEADGTARWTASAEETGVALFKCLKSLGAAPSKCAAFVFCDGPGSVLGIRTVAMAIRAWCLLRPAYVFAYHSLALVAHTSVPAGVLVIADARRGHWHCVSANSNLRRVPTAELAGELVMPDDFRNWTPLPAGTKRVPYLLQELFSRVGEHDLFHAVTAPEAFQHEEPSYAGWTPQIHRAP